MDHKPMRLKKKKKKKKALKEVNVLKGARKERKSKSWAIYDVKKREWATADPK